jgi:hypothetical protein
MWQYLERLKKILSAPAFSLYYRLSTLSLTSFYYLPFRVNTSTLLRKCYVDNFIIFVLFYLIHLCRGPFFL